MVWVFDYDEQWTGTADSKIFESANDFRIESNLEASQVPTFEQQNVSVETLVKNMCSSVMQWTGFSSVLQFRLFCERITRITF